MASPPPSSSLLPPPSEEEDDDGGVIPFGCLSFDDILNYHRDKLNKPDLTMDQLREYFKERNAIIAALPEPDSDDEINNVSMEDMNCFLRCRTVSSGSVAFANRCIVTGLSKNVKIEEVHKLFSEYGEIVESMIITDDDTGESLGYGFVSFKYRQWAFDAYHGLDGKKLGDDTLTVYVSGYWLGPGAKDIVDDQGLPALPPAIKHDKKEDACPPETKHDKKDAAGGLSSLTVSPSD